MRVLGAPRHHGPRTLGSRLGSLGKALRALGQKPGVLCPRCSVYISILRFYHATISFVMVVVLAISVVIFANAAISIIRVRCNDLLIIVCNRSIFIIMLRLRARLYRLRWFMSGATLAISMMATALTMTVVMHGYGGGVQLWFL